MESMKRVDRAQRFSPASPCPICGGHERLPRDRGVRCTGFLSADGEHAHCSREEHAGNLRQSPQSETYAHRLHGPCGCRREHGTVPAPVRMSSSRTIDATYDYCDAEGVLVYQVVRMFPKNFAQRRPDGCGDWIWNLQGVAPLLYRLPELLKASAAEVVYIVEGEKDVDNMRKHGAVATCNSGGAKKWHSVQELAASVLDGRHVVVIPDKDAAGRAHADQVVASLVGIAASVRLVELPGDGKDASDWLAAGGTAAELRRLTAAAVPAPDETHVASPALRLVAPPTSRAGTRPKRTSFPLTDAGNGERFAASNWDFKYDHGRRRWLHWDGKRWSANAEAAAMLAAVQTARMIASQPRSKFGDESDVRRFARSSEGAKHLRAMLELASVQPSVTVEVSALDSDPWLLNVDNGILDLQTGVLEPHDPDKLCSRLVGTPYETDAQAPRFEAFLSEALCDPEKVAFVLRALAYSLTGSTRVHGFIVLTGAGRNGKGVLLRTIAALLGEYAMKCPETLLYENKGGDRHPTELADLRGVRFAYGAEFRAPKFDPLLNIARTKDLSGGDTVRARGMREDFSEFPPTHKLWLQGNRLPKVGDDESAFWARAHVVEFPTSFAGREDTSLEASLREELPGILAMVVRSMPDFLERGLAPPTCVSEATEAWRRGHARDSASGPADVDAFIAERCAFGERFSVYRGDLHAEYDSWARERRTTPLPATVFYSTVRAGGIREGGAQGRKFLGLRLNTDDEADEPP